MGDDASLASLLCGARTDAGLTAALRRCIDDARRAWPELALADEAFVTHLAARLRPDEDPVAGLAALKTSDLYLACAALAGQPAALAAFERTILSRVGRFVGRVDGSPAFVAEVTQALRIKLFVGADGAPRLAQYSGRGALDSWVCAAALRTAYDLQRGADRRAGGDERELDVLAASDDAELELLRTRHEEQFRAAVRASMGALEPRARTLLRMYFLEKLTTAQLGQVYRVHETTALRWIAQAREAVVDGVRARLQAELRLSTSEFDELVALLRSRLDVTVRRLLATSTAS